MFLFELFIIKYVSTTINRYIILFCYQTIDVMFIKLVDQWIVWLCSYDAQIYIACWRAVKFRSNDGQSYVDYQIVSSMPTNREHKSIHMGCEGSSPTIIWVVGTDQWPGPTTIFYIANEQRSPGPILSSFLAATVIRKCWSVGRANACWRTYLITYRHHQSSNN